MDALREFDIEYIKLKDGEHRFEYHIRDSFFETFNSSLSARDLQVGVLLIRSGSTFTLVFGINGRIELDCDRCLSRIELPIHGSYTVLVKITEHPMESEDDLIYLSPHDYKLNIAQHIYDFVHLSIPIKKTCSDIGKVCDPAVTAKINSVIDVDTVPDTLPERDTDDDEEED